MRGLVVAALVCSALSSALLLIGFATPGWLVMTIHSNSGDNTMGMDQSNKDVKVSVGVSVWYARVCINSICLSTSYEQAMSHSAGNKGDSEFSGMPSASIGGLIELQVESAFSLILGVVGLTCIFLYSRNQIARKGFAVGGLFCSLISGILATVLVCRMLSVNQLISANGGAEISNSLETPYSLMIAGAGSLLAYLNVLLVCVALCTLKNQQGGQIMQIMPTSGRGVQLGNIVPGIQHIQQGYTILQDGQGVQHPTVAVQSR